MAPHADRAAQLHGRRLVSPETTEALAQAVRRIRATALVHETSPKLVSHWPDEPPDPPS